MANNARTHTNNPRATTFTAVPADSAQNSGVIPGRSSKAKSKPKVSRPRPTHFLSLPIGHHPELKERIREFHQKLLPSDAADSVAIDGLDRTILVDPRRLHFTLGVMALSADDGTDGPDPDTSQPRPKTLSEAIALLCALAPEIHAIAREPVRVVLDHMGVLKVKRQQAGVLFVGPGNSASADTIRINEIFDLVGQRFRQEGFIEDTRPPLLHCTLINASHRKPRSPKGFSYREIFDRALTHAKTPLPVLESGVSNPGAKAVPVGEIAQAISLDDKSISVDFGGWTVSEIQLCQMGSHGPENEYISVASVALGSN
ncbi:kinase A anchor protein [Mycena sp. CBHHK59/15]|nr:kinase A anchor protein [Mycena sp. CBHHK59/15]